MPNTLVLFSIFALALAGVATADKGFVNLDMPDRALCAIGGRHEFAEFMGHAPRGFVGAADLAL